MKLNKTFATGVVILLIVLVIGANRVYQTRADAGKTGAEVVLTDIEQKPILEIAEQQRQSNLAFSNQMFGAARVIAQQKGIVLGTAVGEYSVSQSPDGRVKFVQNVTPQQ